LVINEWQQGHQTRFKAKSFFHCFMQLVCFWKLLVGQETMLVQIKWSRLFTYSLTRSRDLIISVFVSSRTDGLNLSSVLDCLPPFVGLTTISVIIVEPQPILSVP
jgi:hypothetical protein